MAPLIKKLKSNSSFTTRVCVTAQHREMLDQVLEFFEIFPEYDLNLMSVNQNLFSLTSDIVSGLKPVFDDFRPHYTFVHGDTTTTMAASLASFYSGSKICHIEAGLRTGNKHSPWPEEMNRQLVGRLADFHFVPTRKSMDNLLLENIPKSSIIITGNTVIDALFESIKKIDAVKCNEISYLKKVLKPSKKIILVTLHRRENQGQGITNVCKALLKILANNKDIQIVFPVHNNPKVKEAVYKQLYSVKDVHLINSLGYSAFVWLMRESYLIITDSGGIQEEAPSLGKPVLLARDTTERPEALEKGTVILVGTDIEKIVLECDTLIRNKKKYKKMSFLNNPYGDGRASEIINNFMNQIICEKV